MKTEFDQEAEYDEEKVIDEGANEKIDDKDIVYDITTYGADFDVEGLVKRISRNDIFRPEFQRQFVWSHKAASKFVESILLGLPIPSLFLYKDEDTQKQLIVDGLQRLTTLHSFVKGRLPNSERIFKLVDVKDRFEGKTYDTLEENDRRRFDDTIIHALIIQQTAPAGDRSAVYHIFDRLNSNGTPLQPQEIRIAVYDGPFIEMLHDLNKNPSWREIFGPPHKRSKDQELILRFFAMLEESDEYSRPLNKFINRYVEKYRYLDDNKSHDLRKVFERTVNRVNDALGIKPFRPRNSLNTAIFDSVMVAIAKHPMISSGDIKAAYDQLMKDEEYIDLVTSSTSDDKRVLRRLEIAMEYMGSADNT